MAIAKLHIICGNCGCNNLFTSRIDLTGHDVSQEYKSKFESCVDIYCNNCGTHHDLSDNLTDETIPVRSSNK